MASKFLAALVVKLLYRYNWDEMLTMWLLSLPQVAATLAAALAAVQAGLIAEQVFNTMIVLMLVTSLLGPLLTERFASRLPLPTTSLETAESSTWWEITEKYEGLKTLSINPSRWLCPFTILRQSET
jgi:hypothetical protein